MKISRVIFWITPIEFPSSASRNLLVKKLNENLCEETFNHFQKYFNQTKINAFRVWSPYLCLATSCASSRALFNIDLSSSHLFRGCLGSLFDLLLFNPSLALERFSVKAAGFTGGLSVKESTPLSLSGVEWLGWSAAGPPGDCDTLVSCVTGSGLVGPSPWENSLKRWMLQKK